MDDSLPSYETAVQKNPWVLLAPYLASRDLCSAALVCQKWNDVFVRRLWGNPASHFGVQNDTVYVALTRFKRTLSWARLSVRELTHTLHLPPAHAEIYGGPHYEWLRDILERLPHLQSLIVHGLPFFDHAALLTLRYRSLQRQTAIHQNFPVYGLRLLDASGCSNVTSTGLAEALPHFTELISLDLSWTNAARDEIVLSTLARLPSLRVLSLRGLGLKDSDFAVVTTSIRTRVRSLDVRANQLTDASARLLLEHCIKEAVTAPHAQQRCLTPIEGNWYSDRLDEVQSENLELQLRKSLTQGFVGRLAIEDADGLGITHLYVSNNTMTVEGVSGLIRSKRLQVLDAGNLSINFQRPRALSGDDNQAHFEFPGAEKLSPILAEHGSERMIYLRINHAIITKEAPITLGSPRAEMEGSAAINRPTDAHELAAIRLLTPELDTADTAVYELPGDNVLPIELPSPLPAITVMNSNQDISAADAQEGESAKTSIQMPTIQVTSERQPEVRRGSAYAPEPVYNEMPLSPLGPSMDATGGLSPMSSTFSAALRGPTTPIEEDPREQKRSPRHSASYVEDRRSRLELRQAQENCLHPGMLPKLDTLVLTDVPMKTDRVEVANRLIQFIKDCAEETEIAKVRSRFTYALPPGRSRAIAEREYAHSLFALRRIVLEMAPPFAPPKKVSASWRQYPTKSSTEDTDSEAFWEAATTDFSFFDDDDECGLPSAEPGRYLPLTDLSGLMVAPQSKEPPRWLDGDHASDSTYDIISELSTFRKDRKTRYQTAVDHGDADPEIEGYWPGDITVIRQPAHVEAGTVDYYGNRFEGGYLYR